MKKLIALCLLVVVVIGVNGQNNMQWTWTANTGGNGNDYAKSITTDSAGNAYIFGHFQDTGIFGDTTFIATWVYDMFIAKYDTGGNILWARHISSTDQKMAYDIRSDGGLYIYVTGEFRGNLDFGTVNINSSGTADDPYIAKYDSSGTLIWAKSMQCPNYGGGRSVDVDAAGNLYFVGNFMNTITVDTVTVSGTMDNSVLMKFDPSGTCLWGRAGINFFDIWTMSGAINLEVDNQGNSYYSGILDTDVDFGDGVVYQANGGQQAFVVKYNSSGKCLWANGTSSGFVNQGYGIDLHADTAVFMTGMFFISTSFDTFNLASPTGDNLNGDIFLVKFDSSGTVRWVKAYGTMGLDAGVQCAVDTNGNIYLMGALGDTLIFNNDTLIPAVAQDIFLAKFDSINGDPVWAKQAGLVGSIEIGDIDVDCFGNLYLAGFDINNNKMATDSNAFLAKKGNAGPPPPVNIPPINRADQKNIIIYPNPTTGLFTVAGTTGEIWVYDLFGRLVLQTNKPQVDMRGYAKGMYVWRVEETRGKLVIE